MSTLTEAAAACCACIRVRWLETRHPTGEVSGRWVCSTCEREFVPQDLSAIRSVAAELQCEPTREAVLAAIASGDKRIAHLERTLSRVQDERESSRAALASVGEERRALRAELDKSRADFARDQAELASLRISLAETKKDLEQAAKVTEELVDGLAEETRKRQVAEVANERLRALCLKVAEAMRDVSPRATAAEVEFIVDTVIAEATRG